MAVDRFDGVVAGEHSCGAAITVRWATGPGIKVLSIDNPAGKFLTLFTRVALPHIHSAGRAR